MVRGWFGGEGGWWGGKEKKPIKPKMTDVFEGCKCQKKKMTAKKGKKVKVRKKKKKKR